MKKILIVVIILAVIGIVVSSINKQITSSNALSKVRTEASSAITALNGSNISTYGSRDNCVTTETSQHDCEHDATFNVAASSGLSTVGWATSNSGTELKNSQYPDCSLSKWDSGPNSYFISCSIFW